MAGFINLFVKAGKYITTNEKYLDVSKFSCKYADEVIDGVTKPTLETRAAVGEASIWTEAVLKRKLPNAAKEVKDFFGHLGTVDRTLHRSKSALSIETKMMRGLKKADDMSFHSIEQAIEVIGDGIGSRVITKSLPKLSRREIDSMIKNMTYEGKKLTPEQVKLLKNYIYSTRPSMQSDEAFKLYEAFAQPLIEKRSREVVDELTLGILKHRQMFEDLDLKDLQKRGLFDDDLFRRLETEDIVPIQITQINNYRGEHGLPEFTNAQIQQLSRALNLKNKGKKIVIASDVRGLDDFLYSKEEIAKYSAKAIKASGYRTAQMNILHQNGAFGEIQFRGAMTNIIGEYEHIAYDLRQGKNTLGPLFDDFAEAVGKLSPEQYSKYNKYLEECYNYYNKLELGLPAYKPSLPKCFPKILSEESMKSLHDRAEAIERAANKGFIRYAEAVA